MLKAWLPVPTDQGIRKHKSAGRRPEDGEIMGSGGHSKWMGEEVRQQTSSELDRDNKLPAFEERVNYGSRKINSGFQASMYRLFYPHRRLFYHYNGLLM